MKDEGVAGSKSGLSPLSAHAVSPVNAGKAGKAGPYQGPGRRGTCRRRSAATDSRKHRRVGAGGVESRGTRGSPHRRGQHGGDWWRARGLLRGDEVFLRGSRAFTWRIAAHRSPKDSLPVRHLSPPLQRSIARHSCAVVLIVFGASPCEMFEEGNPWDEHVVLAREIHTGIPQDCMP